MTKFYLVWCGPTGDRAPSVKHATKASADAEAKRLAALNPGQEFYVVLAIARALKADVMFEHLTNPTRETQADDDGIPF